MRFLIVDMKTRFLKNIGYSFLLVIILILGILKTREHLFSRVSDDGDAPKSYGIAIHYKPNEGPFFGKKRGNTNNISNDSISFADPINFNQNRDDAFPFLGDSLDLEAYYKPLLAPDIIAEDDVYNVNVPLSNAMKGDPVRGWIDFNGNGIFEDNEKASSEYKSSGIVTLSWRLPLDLKNVLTIMRLRTCAKLYKEEIEFPNGKATTGEVEDYAVRISKTNVPSTEMKEKLNFSAFTDIEDEEKIKETIKNLTFGNIKFAITLDGAAPDVMGINDKHDASVTGLRLGHFTETIVNYKNPIIVNFKSEALLENFNFQIIDIDGGDKIKIEGFKKGKPVDFEISNLSDNYYAQYNSITKEVYGDISADAGGEQFIQSSLDMGVNIKFSDFIDSVKLTYVDDSPESSGTFTLGNFSVRKYQLEDVIVKDFIAKDEGESVVLTWEILKNENLSSYNIERSIDGKTYEVINTNKVSKTARVKFIDNMLSPIFQVCFYRIKLIEKDNHVNYSPVFRLRRNLSQSLLGFKPLNFNFIKKDSIQLLLLKDMPGEIKLNMYNYGAKKVKEWIFRNKKKSDTILITKLLELPPSIYYIEIFNNNNKFLVEVSNN
jgi:GEVED domain